MPGVIGIGANVLSLPPSVKVYLCTAPTDMRKAYDGLAALTLEALNADPLSGHLFVFHNKRGNRVKILYWDRTGYCLWCKRLEQGCFRLPGDAHEASLEIESSELTLLLEGIELAGARRRKRYRRE